MFEDSFGFDSQRVRDLIKQGDDEASITYINEFVEAGSVRAMIAMADYFFKKGDKESSLAWIDRVERSIADDDFVSPLFLASAYDRGLGCGDAEEAYYKAFALRERVAESGNVSVIYDMMSNYLHGHNGAPKDHERFFYWAKKAAALGSEDAARVLEMAAQVGPEGAAQVLRVTGEW